VDIGCGADKQPGTVGIDCRLLPGVDVVSDFEEGLPFRDGSVTTVHLVHVIEHIKDLLGFMVELYRVCSGGATVLIKTPYYTSREAFVDPTHTRFITEDTFKYFEAPNYYGLECNFRTLSIDYHMRKPFKCLPAHFQKRARRYLWNACIQMDVRLEVMK
jgi:ubiquinone/menaquinone biosynthesis C-methylase UbiE